MAEVCFSALWYDSEVVSCGRLKYGVIQCVFVDCIVVRWAMLFYRVHCRVVM